MRKFLFLFSLAALTACNSEDKTKVESVSATSTDQDLTYPYPIDYSAKFEIGDAKHSQTILNLWKFWDGGDLSKGKDLFADSVEMHIANGIIMKGHRDSVLAGTQQYRNMYSNITSSVDAITSLKSTDKNENWVSVWGKEITTDKSGKVDSTYMHETWRLNKDGKIDFMLQYVRAATEPKM